MTQATGTGTAPTTGTTAGIGSSPQRPDGRQKVTGEFAYSSDLWLDGMLWGATLRSPHPSALILGIDITDALLVPGVHAVLTYKDVPGSPVYGLEHKDQPVLAMDRIRYQGEAVALVAADHPETARRAAKRIKVDYEVLPAITSARQALEPGAPRLHPHGNLLREVKIRTGDPTATADVVVTGEYQVGMQDQAFLGPESGLAVPAEDGGVDLYVATQWLHVDQGQVAGCLGLPPEKVRITLAGVGGAFGAREDLSMQVHACLLALHTGKPVKIVYGREESFFGHVHRHPATLRYEHGATKDGTLVYVKGDILLDGGAYASSSPAVVANAATLGIGPYRVATVVMDACVVYSNNPPCGAMRGFGAVQACFAYESQMDKLAAALGMDPVAFRIQNALTEGDKVPTGQVVDSAAPVAELLRLVAARPLPAAATGDLRAQPGGVSNTTHGEGVRRGVGYAVGIKNICFSEGFDDYSTARVRLELVNGEPVAQVHTAAAEVGQGLVTVLGQIARTELGVEQVVILPADTSIGSAGSSSASRQTYMTGGAVRAACEQVREQAARSGLPAEATVEWHHRPTETLDPETGQGNAHVQFAFAAHRAVVDVDTELGLVKVVEIATAQDVGKAMNPQAVEGQIHGGIAQGLGLAVMEEIQVTEGKVQNPSFTDYLIPTILDMPPVLLDVLELADPHAPYGLRGIGEPPTISSTPAVVAAIRAATGLDLTRVPVRPEHITGT
ncbi:MAG TPA: molybdopterin cofactor-binding domain-containing protein [Streptosporangiaceae bacterium]|nr:molybdopterin cofactor-binding domain-containing protein [Streptosporangiaceae bacterium]